MEGTVENGRSRFPLLPMRCHSPVRSFPDFKAVIWTASVSPSGYNLMFLQETLISTCSTSQLHKPRWRRRACVSLAVSGPGPSFWAHWLEEGGDALFYIRMRISVTFPLILSVGRKLPLDEFMTKGIQKT